MKLKELKTHIKRIPDTLDNLTVGLILPKINATTDFNIY